MVRVLFCIVIVSLLCVSLCSAQGVNCTSVSDGEWTNSSTWDTVGCSNAVANSNVTFYILNDVDVSVDDVEACNILVSGGSSLRVRGNASLLVRQDLLVTTYSTLSVTQNGTLSFVSDATPVTFSVRESTFISTRPLSMFSNVTNASFSVLFDLSSITLSDWSARVDGDFGVIISSSSLTSTGNLHFDANGDNSLNLDSRSSMDVSKSLSIINTFENGRSGISDLFLQQSSLAVGGPSITLDAEDTCELYVSESSLQFDGNSIALSSSVESSLNIETSSFIASNAGVSVTTLDGKDGVSGFTSAFSDIDDSEVRVLNFELSSGDVLSCVNDTDCPSRVLDSGDVAVTLVTSTLVIGNRLELSTGAGGDCGSAATTCTDGGGDSGSITLSLDTSEIFFAGGAMSTGPGGSGVSSAAGRAGPIDIDLLEGSKGFITSGEAFDISIGSVGSGPPPISPEEDSSVSVENVSELWVGGSLNIGNASLDVSGGSLFVISPCGGVGEGAGGLSAQGNITIAQVSQFIDCRGPNAPVNYVAPIAGDNRSDVSCAPCICPYTSYGNPCLCDAFSPPETNGVPCVDPSGGGVDDSDRATFDSFSTESVSTSSDPSPSELTWAVVGSIVICVCVIGFAILVVMFMVEVAVLVYKLIVKASDEQRSSQEMAPLTESVEEGL